jgi:hypothetical protein
MPRVNIEDSLYRDPNFLKLCVAIQCQYKALGLLVTAFSLAQKHFLSVEHDRLIPKEEFPEDLKILCKHGFVEEKSSGFYVKGSESQFSWLIQRSNAGKSQKTKRKEPRKRPKTDDERNRTEPNGSEPLSLTLSLSPTLSPSPANTLSQKTDLENREEKNDVLFPQAQKTTVLQPDKEINRQIWDSYRSSYKNRYGVEPVRNATINAQVSQLAKRLGKEAVEIVSFYLKHSDGFYVSKCHPVGLCLRDAESLRTQWLRGKAITRNDVKRFEQNQERLNLMQAIERGEI